MNNLYLTESMQIYWPHMLDEYWDGNIYTLLILFWFLAWLVASIFQWTAVRWTHLKCLYHVEVITTHTDTQIWHSFFITAPCKTIFLTMEEDNNQSKITCQSCNVFVTCKCRSSELLYITILCAVISNLGLYPEDIYP